MDKNEKLLNIFENSVLKKNENQSSYYIFSPEYNKFDPSGTKLTQISIFDIDRGTVVKDKKTVNELLKILMSEKVPPEKHELLNKLGIEEWEKRAIGTMLGMAIGDAMGARYEYMPLRYGIYDLFDIGNSLASKYNLEPGQWTDDTSMGLCLADSLLMNNGILDQHDLMHRFASWWKGGYNNAFRFNYPPRHSIDLDEEISLSVKFYSRHKVPETMVGNKDTSGKGSIVRNAAIPICYFYDMRLACDMARKQSLVTHQGLEAKECCSLLTYIIIKIFEGESLNNILENLDKNFITNIESIKFLAKGIQEGYDEDRNWNWKVPQYHYSSKRTMLNPENIGYYCMDNMAMSLNTLYNSKSFKEALIRIVNIRGASGSVASVVGQIAGAYYPIEEIPGDWIRAIYNWDHGEIALRGYMLSRLGNAKSYIINCSLSHLDINQLKLEDKGDKEAKTKISLIESNSKNKVNKDNNIESLIISDYFGNKSKINFTNYKIEELLGEGGSFAPIYKILNKEDNKYYAMKEFSIKNENPKKINDMKKEAEILSTFDSKFIVKYYDSYVQNEKFLIFMEFCDGKDLRCFIKERGTKAIKKDVLYKIIKQLCLGIKEIHDKNIIHRDLKPENIFLTKFNDIKIGDFGIARQLDSYKKYTLTRGIGTLQYMAPEMLKDESNSINSNNNEKVYNDKKIDIYSLGCIIYELFHFTKYHNAKISDNIRILNKDEHNPKWQELIDLMLKPDPIERPDINQIIKYINDIKN